MPDGTLPWVSNPVAQDILTYLQIAYPIVLICLYIITFTIRSITTARNDDHDNLEPEQLGPGGKPLPQKSKKKEPAIPNDFDFSRPRKLLFEWLSVGVLGSIGGNIAVVIVHAIVGREEHWWCGQSPTIYLVGSFMVYALLLITMIDSKPSPTLAHLVTWIAASLMEIILLGASFGLYSRAHREPRVGDPKGGELQKNMTEFEITEVTLDLVRIIFLLALVGFYALFVFLQGYKLKAEAARAEERQSLLAEDHAGNGAAGGAANGYGTANGKPHGPVEAPAGWEKPKETPSRSWWEYLRAYTVFLPYIWPYKDRMLQVNFVLCFVIVGAQRVIQLLVPIQAGNITDILAGVDGPVYMPWGAISLYIVFRIF
ncbi:hypothetical protein KC335_g13869, partial [Hortaea werneckii]